jgi:lipopolysaccharide/colanic/teichoic acid biosynthesis glycosyltransferase
MSLDCELLVTRPGAKPHPLSDPEIYLGVPEREWYPKIRRLFELPIAIALLFLSLPVMAIAALLVRMTSRGPVVYSQVRLGFGGQPYRVFKIRSMVHDCERISGPQWSSHRDPRVLPVGRIIRMLHIDELPQLWNVLRGEMSLIGPRPERPEFVLQLERSIPRYRERLRVRPGMTGFAQIQLPADSDLESVRRKLAYDLYYVEEMSAWLDLRILFGTGLKLLGVPFSLIRSLFGMPTSEKVEEAYWRAVPITSELGAAQLQPA